MTRDRASEEEQLAGAVAAIRSYDAVVVLGAGASAFGYPTTPQLPALLWQAVSDVEGASEELRHRVQMAGSPKDLIGSDSSTLDIGWQLARDFPKVRWAFQHAFAALDAERDPSPAHINLARLIHHGKIDYVVSYNWDSCLERAYEQLYGTELPSGTLSKPHGDVASPGSAWVFPDEPGLVPTEVREKLAALADRPRALVVLGYSESDEYVAENLLTPLQSRWPVVRVSPSATGEGAIAGTADEVTAAITERLLPGGGPGAWRYVRFSRSRDFAAALRGERLRPVDVDACPELPVARRLAQRLRASKFATLSGESGSGKSISAFHAARHLNREGWAVVELRRPGTASPLDVAEFAGLRGTVLAIVDDAQAIAAEVIADFEAAVDGEHAVLLVSTERLENRGDETLVAAQAQQVIYEYCLAHIDEVGPLLSELDDRVAKSSFRETPRLRLEVAHATARQPWLFTFVASGGERRMTGALDRLVEHGTAAIVLGFISIGQLVSQDAGVTRVQLERWLDEFAQDRLPHSAGATTESPLNEAMEMLTAERLIDERGGRLRAAHIRIADRALYMLGQREEADIGSTLLTFVRSLLLDQSVAVIGKYWLIRTFDRSDVYRRLLRPKFLDDDVVTALVGQGLTAAPGRERGVALHLLWTIVFMWPVDRAALERVAARVAEWLPDVLADDVYGYRWILSGLRSRHEDLHAEIRRSMPADELARAVSTRGTRRTAGSWSDLIKELAPPAADATRPLWVADFTAGADVASLQSWLADTDADSHPSEIFDFIDMLVAVSPQSVREAFDATAPHLRRCLEQDLADAVHGISDWAFGSMLLVAHLADARGSMDADTEETLPGHETVDDPLANHGAVHEPQLRAFSARILEFMESVNWEKAGKSLIGKERHEIEQLDLWLFWLGALSLEVADRLAVAIPDGWIHELAATANGDRTPGSSSRDLALEPVERLLYGLSAGNEGAHKVRRFIEEREASLPSFPFLLIKPFSDIAARMALTGRTVRLQSPRGRSWEPCTSALQSLAQVDRDAASRVLAASTSELREALEKPQAHDMKGLPDFLAIADELDAGTLDSLIGGLDPGEAEHWWRQRLADASGDVAVILKRAANLVGPVGELARSLLSEA